MLSLLPSAQHGIAPQAAVVESRNGTYDGSRSLTPAQGGAVISSVRSAFIYKTIVLAYDGSESGQRALLDCQEIGQWSQARLHLVAVMAPPMAMVAVEAWALGPSVETEEKAHYQSVLDAGLRRLHDAGLAAQGEVVMGYAVDEIAGVAKAVDADLIVLGHKHLDSWAARWWRGASVSQSLIEIAPCSVLIVVVR